ncbi:MAG: aspartyl protease family protein [Cyclobacteriaceae bacterium]
MKRKIVYLVWGAMMSGCVIQQPVVGDEKVQAVNFEIHNNILIVEAYVNQKWAKFVVDTGASISLLDYNQAKKYDFRYFADTDTKLTGFGGRSRLMKTSGVAFRLHGLNDRESGFFASDLSGINKILSGSNQRVLGILGSDFLIANGAVIDYQLEKIKLNSSVYR